MTYDEIITLREKLEKDEISIDEAENIYFTSIGDSKKRSWHTKDWKERRSKIIKNQCEICGSTETLTLQHLSHPKKYRDHKREIETNYTRLYCYSNSSIGQQELLTHVKSNFDYSPVDLCPNCNNRHPNKRMRKTPQYLCINCRLEFDKAAHKSVEELVAEFYNNAETLAVKDRCFVSKNEYRNKENLKEISYWFLRECAKEKYKDEIRKKALLNCLKDSEKYLSFVDTITCCKRCAANHDLNNMDICPVCKKYYKGIQYKTCIECLPEDKRKSIKEKIEFAKYWKDMHEALGID